MRSHPLWGFLILVTLVTGIYALRLRPASRRDWQHVAAAIAFVLWLLFAMTGLKSL